MGLQFYERKFSELRMNRTNVGKSPHKVAMLLAVIDLFENDSIKKNEIFFDDLLKTRFTYHLERIGSPIDRNNPYLSYFHLRSSGFWHHYLKPGMKELYENLKTVSGPGEVDKYIRHVVLDDELFELLGNLIVRKVLREALFRNLEYTDLFGLIDVGKGWNWLECELVVDLYFKMLSMQVNNVAFVKTRLYSELVPKLDNRNYKAVESKCQNVSAIMVQCGYPYVIGLKPRWNYQKQLEDVVLSQLAGRSKDLDGVIEKILLLPDGNKINIDWNNVFDPVLPEHIPCVKEAKTEYFARKVNFSQLEYNNRELGNQGEEFVIEFEKQRLTAAGRVDLVNEVEWSSQIHGDGLGFDIRSFNPKRDEELFIEVKTTNSGKYQPFFISEREVNYSREFSKKYSLYRIYQFKSEPRLFNLNGEIDQYVNLHAESYRASFS